MMPQGSRAFVSLPWLTISTRHTSFMQPLQDDEAYMDSMFDPNHSLKRTASELEQGEGTTSKRTRGRSGCLNCRRRRKKCDEAKPECSKCRSRGEDCEWDTGITFRLTGLGPDHPSMLQARTPKSVVSQNGLKIVDVHFNSRNSSSPSDKAEYIRRDKPRPSSFSLTGRQDAEIHEVDEVRANGQLSSGDLCVNGNEVNALCTITEEPCLPAGTCSTSKPKCQAFPYEQANPVDLIKDDENAIAVAETTFDVADDEMPDYPRSNSDSSASMPSVPWSAGEQTASSVTSVSSRSSKYETSRKDSWNDGLTHLDCLDSLMDRRSTDGVRFTSISTINGAVTADSTFEKSRQKLHSRVQDIVQKFTLAHQTSSDTDADESAVALSDLRLNENKFKSIRLVSSPLIARPLGCTKLLKRRQLELWRNYLDNIAPSLDVCGNKHYFQHHLPMLAKSADHLHYAVLALSSRHMENLTPQIGHTESNGLYQDATNLLLDELHTLDTPTIATILMLCIMDLLTSPPSRCTESLATCAALMDVADFNARSGGLRQALFWCFANFATWHNLSHQETPSAISTRSFYPTDSLTTSVNHIRSLTFGDGYAKYIIYLTSVMIEVNSILDLAPKNKKDATAMQTQYSALTALLADWTNCRPEDMQPLMSYPSILDNENNPFPMVLYPTITAAIGNLLYHCASIVLIQQTSRSKISASAGTCANRRDSECEKLPSAKNSGTKCTPPETASGKGITWHARQICGILSESNDQAVLLHGRHALDIAGKVVTNDVEKEAILALLDRMERETGWPSRLYEK